MGKKRRRNVSRVGGIGRFLQTLKKDKEQTEKEERKSTPQGLANGHENCSQTDINSTLEDSLDQVDRLSETNSKPGEVISIEFKQESSKKPKFQLNTNETDYSADATKGEKKYDSDFVKARSSSVNKAEPDNQQCTPQENIPKVVQNEDKFSRETPIRGSLDGNKEIKPPGDISEVEKIRINTSSETVLVDHHLAATAIPAKIDLHTQSEEKGIETKQEGLSVATGHVDFFDPKRTFELLGKTDDGSGDSVAFFKGAKFSKDGSCVLSSGDDKVLRVFETKKVLSRSTDCLKSILQISEGECIYDYCLYPFFDSNVPASCCFASTSKEHPIHLWDAYCGNLRASYSPINDNDELGQTLSLSFNLNGDKLFAGGHNCIYIFDVSIPGRQIECRKTIPTRKSKDGQRGLISCIAFNPDLSGIFAAGDYSKTIHLYSENDQNRSFGVLSGPTGGITSLAFTPDGKYLLSGSRKDNQIFCWDIRKAVSPVLKFERQVDTNQRIHFDIDFSGTYLVSGSTDGIALIFNLKTGELEYKLPKLKDAVNGASFHPHTYKTVLLSTGQRHFDDEVDIEQLNSIQIWGAK